MAEDNILDIFKGATKSLCNSVLNQVQDAVVWLDRDRKVRLLEQGGRADLRPGGRRRPGEGLFRGAGPVRGFRRGRHLPREVPRGHDPQGRRPAHARRLSPAQGRVPDPGLVEDHPRAQGRRRDHRGRRDVHRHRAEGDPAAGPARAREDGPRRDRDGHPLQAVPGHDPGHPARGIPEVRPDRSA